MASKTIVVCGVGGFIEDHLVANLLCHGLERTYHWIYQQMAPRTAQRPAIAQVVQ